MPLPGSKVIPTRWSRHHAPTASGGMNGKCRIYNPEHFVKGWDEATESATLDRGPALLDGPCRIQAVTSEESAVQADDSVTSRRYLVQLDFDAPHLETEWVLVPYEVINDAELDGIDLSIEDVQRGTERFTRDLICSHNQQ